jgi:uncharacterized protein (DUF1015 family)
VTLLPSPAPLPGWRQSPPDCYNTKGYDHALDEGGSMVAASPFQGLRFDRAVVGDPCRVTAPPYDVITAEGRDAYEAMHPYNVVRLILARGQDDDPGYGQVAKLLSSWCDEGALLLDPAPMLYVYEEAYTVRGERRRLRGVLASVILDDSGEAVLPHERTMIAPVADRLHLLEATRTNLSPVFGVYSGSGRSAAALGEVTAAAPVVDCLDETGTGHRLWPVGDPERIAAWCRALADQRVLIADGHHRYRTALAYRDAMRRAAPDHPAAPWERTLMLLVDIDQHGPTVLAIHRLLPELPPEAVLAALARDFDAHPVAGPLELEARLERLPPGAIGYGLYGGGRSVLLVARDPAAFAARTGLDHPPLDVEILHGPVLAGLLGVRDTERQIAYESDLAEAAAQVDRGASASLLVLRPAPFPAVVQIAERGRILPPKTTFFYPKPRDGLVLRPLEPETFARPPQR